MDACLAQEGSKGSPQHFAGGMGGGLSSGLKQSSYSYFLWDGGSNRVFENQIAQFEKVQKPLEHWNHLVFF